MEQLTPIRDKVSLRHVSIDIATKTLQYIHSCGSNISYDINNHLGIAKAIERYIKGDATLPEYSDPYKDILSHFKAGADLLSTRSNTPNFEVKE